MLGPHDRVSGLYVTRRSSSRPPGGLDVFDRRYLSGAVACPAVIAGTPNFFAGQAAAGDRSVWLWSAPAILGRPTAACGYCRRRGSPAAGGVGRLGAWPVAPPRAPAAGMQHTLCSRRGPAPPNSLFCPPRKRAEPRNMHCHRLLLSAPQHILSVPPDPAPPKPPCAVVFIQPSTVAAGTSAARCICWGAPHCLGASEQSTPHC